MIWPLYCLTPGPPHIRPPSAPIEPMSEKPAPPPNEPAAIVAAPLNEFKRSTASSEFPGETERLQLNRNAAWPRLQCWMKGPQIIIECRLEADGVFQHSSREVK